MMERKLIIQNKYGLHARPAVEFVQIASRYNADITISKDGVEVNGKSMMGVLMLAADKGSEVILKAKGKDEEELIEALTDLLMKESDE
jgi:phosphocarrier protein HPr